MGSSSVNDTYIMEEGQQLDHVIGDRNVAERSRMLLNAPDPPGLCSEFVGSIKEIVNLPNGNKSYSSSKKKPELKQHVGSVLRGLFPILSWGRSYTLSKFKSDLMSGLTLASLSIPQSIGYANLAKLDPQYGLYTNVVPPLVYALMGSSREIAIGPVAVVSLLLSSMVQKIIDPAEDPTGYKKFVFTVTLFAGTFQAAFGLFRLGFLIDFLSHSAIVGFMGGAAIVIGLQQLKGLLGFTHFTNNTDVISVVRTVWRSFHDPWSPHNFILGCSFLIFILFARFLGRRNKKLFWLPAIAPLISVILSTLIVYLSRADKHGVRIVKHIDRGLNPSSAKQLQFSGPHVGEAAKTGLICAIIALTEAVAVGRSFAGIKGYHIDGNKEMVAIGFTNILGSLTSCYVATGSFSRTAVNFSAGCETAISNVVMALTVILALEFFTRLLYYTPTAILASIILSALPGLIDINGARNIYKIDKYDFLACFGTFLGVLFASVEIGLLIAVTISFSRIILNSIRPGINSLGQLPGTNNFCSTNQFPMSIKIPGVLILRVESSYLGFANASYVRERILRWVTEEENEESKENARTLQVVVLDMTNVLNIDTSGLHALEELHKELVSFDLQLAIASPTWKVMHKLKLSKFVDIIGSGWIFLTVSEAVDAYIGPKMVISLPC
ncbi:hypothetical protein MKX01_032218 [Papaver californicum]|nr:hypothetical protein MKX01_032218 [Papaver californicum]